MEHTEIYFDNNATTRPLPEVREAMLRVLGDEFGNPSSAHSTGERARGFIREARRSLAELIGVRNPRNIVFTSSGTEANNMAFYSCTRAKNNNCRVITTSVEHSSIQKMCSYLDLNGVDIAIIGVDHKGHLDLNELEDAINKDTVLVSVQWVNNETGVIQPIQTIGQICKDNNIMFHTDAAQAVGKIEMDISTLPIDLMSVTGHKFHSPQGIGSIACKEKYQLAPMMFGGFQEEGFRPSTENVPGIVGMGKAAEIRKRDITRLIASMRELRNRFESMVLDFIPGTVVNGDTKNRVCNTTNIRFEGIDGKLLIKILDEKGVRCSQSSACTNFEVAPSYVLKAMGLTDEQAYSSIRFSFSVENTVEEVDTAVDIIRSACNTLQS